MADSTPSETTIASAQPEMGGGLPVIGYWAEKTVDLKGGLLWKTLLHKSACLSCACEREGKKVDFRMRMKRICSAVLKVSKRSHRS